MAKKSKKVKATRSPKASGPIRDLRALFAKLDVASTEATAKVIEFADAKGINKGTALTQLSRYRKEQGVSMRAASAGGKKKATKKSEAKGKKKATKKSKTPAAGGLDEGAMETGASA